MTISVESNSLQVPLKNQNNSTNGTSSFRIELLGQRQDDASVKIDRALSAILSPYISNNEWEMFCNRVDGALEPLEPLKRKVLCMYRAGWGIFLSMFVLFGILGASSFGVVIYPFIGVLIVGPPIFIMCWVQRIVSPVTNKAMDDVRKILSDESGKRSNVSFHLKEDTHVTYHRGLNKRNTTIVNYIECVVGFAAIPSGAAESTFSSPVATPAYVPSTFDALTTTSDAGSTGKTAAERLHELEGIKALITYREYDEKKKAILADL